MAWRLAESIRVLRDEVDARWPNRDKTSDGTIGDAAHQSRTSDHNPYIKDSQGVGVVRAFDIDEDLDGNQADTGADAEWLAEHFRELGRLGDPRVRYVIYEKRIASSRQDWAWRPYSGPNAHRKHIHLSVVEDPAGYDSTRSWGVIAPIDIGEGFLSDLSEAEQQEVLTKTREIHDTLFKSVPSKFDNDGYETKAGTIYWRITHSKRQLVDLVTGRRPEK